MKDIENMAPGGEEEMADAAMSHSEELALDMMEHKLQSEALGGVAGMDEECLSLCQTMEDVSTALSEHHIRIPDVDQEFARFGERMNAKEKQRKALARPMLRYALAIAAVFAALLLVTTLWKQHHAAEESLSAESSTVGGRQHGDTMLFQAVEEEPQITLQAGNKVIPINEHDAISQSVLANLAQDQKETVIVRIPRGKVYSTMLADGTQVWLNADSKLLHPITFNGSSERRVRLEGEAYFKVAKDAAHPFIVEMNDTYIKVLGTEFNVRTRETGSQEVTLVNGSVSVHPHEGGELTLKPGQQFVCNHLQISVREVDTDPYVYWKNGSFYFDNDNIDRILTEIGRWYNVNVQLQNRDILNYKFHFIADRDSSLSQIIDLLNQMDKVTIRKKGNTLMVY